MRPRAQFFALRTRRDGTGEPPLILPRHHALRRATHDVELGEASEFAPQSELEGARGDVGLRAAEEVKRWVAGQRDALEVARHERSTERESASRDDDS